MRDEEVKFSGTRCAIQPCLSSLGIVKAVWDSSKTQIGVITEILKCNPLCLLGLNLLFHKLKQRRRKTIGRSVFFSSI